MLKLNENEKLDMRIDMGGGNCWVTCYADVHIWDPEEEEWLYDEVGVYTELDIDDEEEYSEDEIEYLWEEQIELDILWAVIDKIKNNLINDIEDLYKFFDITITNNRPNYNITGC